MDKKRRNYKLIVDPFLHRGQQQKVYRFDGINPVDNQLVEVKDPRPRIQRSWFRRQPADLPIPRFKYDCYYVGTPPAKEVTFSNLNDNVNKDFLENMCKSFGKVEECKIYYNPKTKKHMGVGKVVFTSSKAAKSCAEKLNQTSKMGNIMTVVIDTMGKERAKMIEDMLNERRVHHLQKSSSQETGVQNAKNSLRREAYDPGDNEFDFGRRTSSFDFTPRSESGYSGSISESGYSGPTPSSVHSDHGHSGGKSSGHYPDSFKHTPYSAGNRFEPDYNSHQSVSQDFNYGMNNFGNQHNTTGPTYDDSGFTQMNPPKFDPTRPPPNHPDFHRKEHEHQDKFFKDGDLSKQENSRSFSSNEYKDRGWHNDKHHWISNRPKDKGKDHGWDRGHDKDRGRDRYNNNRDSGRETNHGRNYDRGHDYVRDNGLRDREYSGDWEKEKPKVRNKVAKPKIPVEEPDDEPRSLSLESRIQSLLTGNDPDAELDSQTPKPSEEPSLLPPSSNTWDRSPQVPSKQVPQTPTSYDLDKNSPSWRASSSHLVHQTPIESPWPQTPMVPESPWPSQTPSVQTPTQAPADEWNNVDKQSFGYDSKFKSAPPVYNPQEDLKQSMSKTNVQPETNNVPAATAVDDDDDDKMSISSISSGDEKLEVNSQIPTKTSQPSSLTNSFQQSLSMFNQGPIVNPWQSGFVNQGAYPPTYNNFVGLNPFNQTFCNQYQNDMVNAQMVNAYGNQMGFKEEEKVPEIDDKLFNSSLNNFVKDLKEILQRDLCKKMVESSAFKSFEKWWDREEEKRKPPKLLGSQDKSEKCVPSKPAPTSQPQSAMSSTIASLFESRHPWSREGGLESGLGFGQGFGVGGLLGLRGGMPKMPSFKKKMRAPTPPQEEEGESQSSKSKVIDEEAESDHESPRLPRNRKPVVSESEEESEEEEEKAQSDDEDENEDSSEDEEEEESDDESDESSSDDEEEDEVDEDELEALQKDIDEEAEVDESKSKVKAEIEESDADIAKRKEDAKPLSPITEEAMEDENEEVDIETDETQDTSVAEVKSDSEITCLDKDTEAELKEESETANSSETSDSQSPTKEKKKKILPSSMAPELVDLIRKTIKDKKILREVKTSESEVSEDHVPPPVGNEEELSLQKDDERKPYVNPAIAEHDYFAVPPVLDKSAGDSDATASADEESGGMPHEIWMDHNYCMPRAKFELSESELQDSAKKGVIRTNKAKHRESTESGMSDSATSTKDKVKEKPKRKYTKRKNKEETLTDITHTLNRSTERGSRELANLLPPPKPKVNFSPRSFQEERQTFFGMYHNGIDNEDVGYLKRTYDELMQSDDPMFYWLNDILWVDHPVTNIPDPAPSRKRRKVEDLQYKTHKTGCSRTEGYYKLTMQEKAAYLLHARNVTLQQKVIESINKTIAEQAKKNVVSSRDARNENRRLQTALSDLPEIGELLKFNQLKFRKKQLRFAKSSIHDWGLFALEPIAADEMVIEYCGQMVRQSVADLREKKYENTGIGSSYLFRVDGETIIDATKTGNLARFINHSCNPNCYAKIISVEGLKKIVIYSKRDIDVNEEITYDYKFPIEDEKIPCLCMAHGCRGTLN
ncbi:histone-lysine N-methyltransferase SETD1-like [Gigantopelta aegis]|uniref:histone-lysine N-methyltransferase SETD1-like n=1 Tax=Gigantopelta aegis TaxID=1735272 RepID=UPI001B887492|nr:histone-lysine N-methyltransferase SETD1-like [Gigantopelta aegis]